jgi:hypothetical protein
MHGTRQSETTLKKQRSRITNNRSLFPRKLDGQSVDNRTVWARRVRDLVASFTSDAGGDDRLSEAMRSLIRRVALIQVQLERMEAKWAIDDGEATPASLDQYQKLSNSMRRLIETAGLKTRKAKTVPDLKDYVASRNNGRDRNYGRARVIEHGD